MSGAPPLAGGDDLALDADVLAPGPLLEFQGHAAVAAHGGMAVLPWFDQHHEAMAAGLTVACDGTGIVPGAWDQAVVRLQKGRAAVEADLAMAWMALRPGGRLVLTGPGSLGISGWARRLAAVLGAPIVAANRAHGRALRWMRSAHPDMTAPVAGLVPLHQGATESLAVPAGVFSGDGLDAGTATLQQALADRPTPTRVLDACCGAGHLGLCALRRWPTATALLLDADARAVAAAAANAGALVLAERSTVAWWSATRPVPADGFDLALCNPPAHSGEVADADIGIRCLRRAAESLAPGGVLLAVANARLPYERPLAALGRLREVLRRPGFKVLEVTRG